MRCCVARKCGVPRHAGRTSSLSAPHRLTNHLCGFPLFFLIIYALKTGKISSSTSQGLLPPKGTSRSIRRDFRLRPSLHLEPGRNQLHICQLVRLRLLFENKQPAVSGCTSFHHITCLYRLYTVDSVRQNLSLPTD